jgi:hypothetical protein
MKKVSESQFISDYGFKSNNFSVDNNGNITANSISVATESPDEVLSNYKITTDVSSNFLIENYQGTNPTIQLIKARTYIIELSLTTTGIYFLKEDQTSFYTDNLIHSSGDQGTLAQGKTSGTLSITVPSNYNESVIYYSNESRSIFGQINVIAPEGNFSSITVSENINIAGVGIPRIASETNLDVEAGNKIVIRIDDVLLGDIDSEGISIPINNTTLNNTVIGGITPSSATFTTAQLTKAPTNNNDVTTKTYVDTTVTALSIAFGL